MTKIYSGSALGTLNDNLINWFVLSGSIRQDSLKKYKPIFFLHLNWSFAECNDETIFVLTFKNFCKYKCILSGQF